MAALAYENLARDILLLLIESGELESVDAGRLIAYETYHLPPLIELDLPDVDGYEKLLNPHTTTEHSRLLAASLLQVVASEERNSWVKTTEGLTIQTHLSATGAPRATPCYAPPTRDETPVDEATRELAEALVRVVIEGDTYVFRRGEGLKTLINRSTRPRISLMEATEGLHEAAWLVAGGPTSVRTADGRTRDYDAHAKIPVIHDMTFVTRGRRLRPWERDLEGELKVLGVSRARRPALVFARDGEEVVEWDRNKEPLLEAGQAPEARVPFDDHALRLTSGAGDHIEVESLDHRSVFLTWFDGAPLLVPSRTTLPIQGSHLSAIGHGADAVEVAIAGSAPYAKPRVIEVRGWMPKTPQARDRLGHLFGFDQPVATVYEEGQILDPSASDEPIRVPVLSPALLKPLFLLALDGTRGAKLKPLTVELQAEHIDLHIDAWSWIEGVVALDLPGLRLRLEALGRVKLIYSEPWWVTEVSGDPTDAWQHHGWRFRVTPAALEIDGQGRGELIVDQRSLKGDAELPALREHRVQVGRGLFRIVRREVAG